MYTISRDFFISYGHRLLNYDGKCAHLHGHNGKVRVSFYAESLDERGMILDFTEVKRIIGKWLKDSLDHKMILRNDDPVVRVLQEMGEPLFLIPDNPTAENLARLVFEQAEKLGLPVYKVEFWESQKSCACYSAK